MGKMKRSYRIFLLFLLVSISVFALSYERVIIEGIDTKNYDEIKINLVSITDNDVNKLELLNVKETRVRDEVIDEVFYDNIMISTKIELENIKINGENYKVTNNKITIDNREQFVYGWVGTYKTKFRQEEGKERKITFKEKRYLIPSGNPSRYNLSKSYIEHPKVDLTPRPSEQWIYSQITKENLLKSEKNSERYKVDFYERLGTIKTINEDGNLDELLRSDDGYSNKNFIQEEKERYKYEGEPKSVVEFKIISNIGKPQNGKFELTIEEDNVFKRKINESYTIPVPITGFEEQDLESSKNTFTYKDNYELENLKAYKYQEVVFRLYTGSKHDGVRPIKKIENNELSNSNYVDFVFENNGSIQEIEKDGAKARFIEGKFELMGLESGKPYKLDFYTLRYRNTNEKGNYAAVTYESSLGFTGKNLASTENTVWLEDINISEYKKIKLNMMTVTTEDLRELDILDLNEIRDGQIEYEDTRSVAASKVLLNKIWISGEKYEVIENQITLNGKNKYVYKWTGSYDTEFEPKEGKVREIKFWSRRYSTVDETYKDELLTGKYIEPTPVELDEGEAHQWVMFEFNPAKGLKNQNYKIEDRVLSPEREGYKHLKTVDYEISLDDVLYGKNEHSLKNEFDYSDGVWKYPANTSSTGLIIEKTITESKGTLKDEDGEGFVFYTDKIGSGIEKIVSESKGNKVTYRWNEGPLNTNGEILNYDKVIFRITKKSASGDYSWNPYDNTNPINYLDDKSDGDARLEEFLLDSKNYVDLVLDASTSKTMTFTNAIISYEQTNKELRIVGLPVGNYTIQFYSVKRGHDGRYKVITRENPSEFHMDISDIASPDFEKENNIHKIDFITTGTSRGAIQVNVNFITKMKRELDLTVDNLKSGDFNIEETNEGTGGKEGIGESGNISLKESDMKKFLFPLDVVFVIDNSGSMQDEIDKVKDGLSAFGQELLDRGFDVKYNLITFGPEQNHKYNTNYYNGFATGDWATKIKEDRYLDRGYMAIYKDKWFDGSKIGKQSNRENDLEELVDAFDNINAVWGYDYGQENSAWGIHYAIEKLRTNGRYLSYSGEIVEDSSKGYMPSEKMIIFLTDENMDSENLPSGYDKDNVLQQLYSKLNGTYKNMPDVIDLNGIFHIRKRGNTTNIQTNELTYYEEEGVPNIGYKYTYGHKGEELVTYYKYRQNGNSNNGWWQYQGEITREEWNKNYKGKPNYEITGNRFEGDWWIEYDDNETPILGIDPADKGDISHTDFKYYNTANNFFMYEIGEIGEGVEPALDRAINNLGIIQRWELSYLTPFNEYDGTTRTVDFELVDLEGRDGESIDNNKIVNLNREKDKQYTVKEEKLALEFMDPSADNLKLSIVDGRGTITFRGKARYNEFDEENNPIVVEDMINEYKLDVLDSNNKLLFSRNTDNIEMSLSDTESLGDTIGDQGWYEFKVYTPEKGDIPEKIGLTEAEMQILINSETVKSTGKINLEATIVTDLFNKTEVLKDVEVDLSTPKITKVTLKNKTLFNFLNTMQTINKSKTFSNPEEYSGYNVEIGSNYIIPNDGSYGKNGDKIDLELIVEGKNIDEYDVATGIAINGWSNPIITSDPKNDDNELKKFKVSWEGDVISDKTTSINNIENQYGLKASQEITVLEADSEIEVFPKVIGIELMDNIYYVNSNYNIELGTTDTTLRGGIATLDYDKAKSDKKDGDPQNYYEIKKPIFGGGVRSASIPVVIDISENHSTDGEYKTQVYGMSRSGQLNGVTDYSSDDFRTIMENNFSGKEITVRVDTVAPKITNVVIGKSEEDSEDDKHYYFDVSFQIEDFNASYKKREENTKGGHSLEMIKNNIEILGESIYDGDETVTYKIKVKKPETSNGLITEVKIIVEDKAGNPTNEESIKIRMPKDIVVKTYEEVDGWGNGKKTKIKDSGREYTFTKGGLISLINDPVIYAVVPKSAGPNDETEITKLKIEKLNEDESLIAEKTLDLSGETKNVEISFNFVKEGKNIVRVTPVSKVGIEGKSEILNFVVDTKINTSYLNDEIIGELNSDGKIVVDLANIIELSGVSGYEYTFTVGKDKRSKDLVSIKNAKSFSHPTGGSITGKEEIATSGFIGGSKGTLLFTVHDRLGHEKTFKKTYFIPKQSDGIIAKIYGEVKQRESRIKIVTEGSNDKFGIESSIDGSSEKGPEKPEEEPEEESEKVT